MLTEQGQKLLDLALIVEQERNALRAQNAALRELLEKARPWVELCAGELHERRAEHLAACIGVALGDQK